MPHVVIECSHNVLWSSGAADACAQAGNILRQSKLFQPEDIKTRLYVTDAFCVGTQGINGSFVHATIHLMAGRTAPQRQDLGAALLALLQRLAPHVDSTTVDVQEIDPATYQKV